MMGFARRGRRAEPTLDIEAALEARRAQDRRCARGEHDVAVARCDREPLVLGRSVTKGTRYCRACEKVLA